MCIDTHLKSSIIYFTLSSCHIHQTPCSSLTLEQVKLTYPKGFAVQSSTDVFVSVIIVNNSRPSWESMAGIDT